MKVHASLNNLRVSPRKTRLVTRALVGVDVREALLQLSKATKKSATPLHTLLRSAIANATNNFGLDEANLYVADVQVGDGLRLKRWLPRAFGRATPLLRRGSKVTVILEEKIEGKNRVKKAKKETVDTEAIETPAAPAKEEGQPKRAGVMKTKEKAAPVQPKAAAKKIFQRKAV
ncbi:MAG: 50S ribosomal protein L22 [Candidatus Moranbacteria bacterium RIFCSPHIGHO2_01_FULL_55_24]|nr:MAG: 50S ribosomal protein L22 [Candidatus Moranbacteria bacterium RIFCSPHIGHO2_01_FULL_55_24]